MFLIGRQRLELEFQHVLTARQGAIKRELERTIALACEAARPSLLPVDPQGDPAFVVVELIVHEPLGGCEIQHQLERAALLEELPVGDACRLVIGKGKRSAGGCGCIRCGKPFSWDHRLRGQRRFSGDGPLHDRLRCGEVFFQQHGRHRQHFTDVVEPMAAVVGGEFNLGVKLDSEQVVDGVAILGPVQTSNDHVARIRICRVGVKNGRFDPLLKTQLLLRGGLGFFHRRHQSGADVFKHREPERVVRQRGVAVGKLVQGDSPLFCPVGVAVTTELGE